MDGRRSFPHQAMFRFRAQTTTTFGQMYKVAVGYYFENHPPPLPPDVSTPPGQSGWFQSARSKRSYTNHWPRVRGRQVVGRHHGVRWVGGRRQVGCHRGCVYMPPAQLHSLAGQEQQQSTTRSHQHLPSQFLLGKPDLSIATYTFGFKASPTPTLFVQTPESSP
jgi:hypothetical protein